MENLIFERRGGVALITLNRPSVYNSFDRVMALALQDALTQCAQDPEVRCVYLTGAGKAFCAGQDLKEAIDPDNGLDLPRILAEHYNPIIRQIRALEKPVVCAVNGVAAGAGANIALACDIVVASEKASFLQAFAHIGLIPDSGGTYSLPRLIGWQKASALMMLGEKLPASEAESLGMIYKVFPAEEFESASLEIALRLATMPTRGLGYTKRALNASLTNDLEAQLALEKELQTAAGETEDYEEGVKAFLEKRKANFKGK
jgi:2-(1,2-epoxy-1,2-dihydrophenyl)acetyl-CoA isomerase